MNWFKKEKKVEVVAQPAIAMPEKTAVKNNYPAVVEEIHREFHSAGDVLLVEAQEILKKAQGTEIEKGKRMLSLGFKQAQQAEETGKILHKAAASKEVAELVRYYQVNYPNNKFITEEQVQAICFKYNLICGEVGRYKGFVPEKNLKEVEAFRAKDGDVPSLLFDVVCDRVKLPSNQIDDSFLTEYGKSYFSRGVGLNYAYITACTGRVELGSTSLFGEKCTIFNGNTFVKIINKEVHELQICAPVKDMDLTGMTIVDGYKMIKHIPDSVVLQHVKGGYLILTAWGDEASDENVVNKQMNKGGASKEETL